MINENKLCNKFKNLQKLIKLEALKYDSCK